MNSILWNYKSRNIEHFSFVSVMYILLYVLSILIPFSLFIIVLFTFFYNRFLCLRISIVGLVMLVNNQFVLDGLTQDIYGFGKFNVYQAGLLFYIVVFSLIYHFSRISFSFLIRIFLLHLSVLMVFYILHIFESFLFLFNVLGGFLALFTLLYCLSTTVKSDKYRHFQVLKFDFFYIIIFIIIASFFITVIDICTDFILLKYQANSISNYRGGGEVLFVNGFPKIYTTGFGNYNFLLRYTPLINDPIRAAFWYISFIIFIGSISFNIFQKILVQFILIILLLSCFSKGGILFLTLTFIFYFFYKRNHMIASYLFFINLLGIMIYLSFFLKSSAIIHVLGLLEPFKSSLNLNYFFGHGLYEAGNMGRKLDEYWFDSIKRGAESLVGTYFYAFGVLGVLTVIRIHYTTIKKLIFQNYFIIAAIITSSLFVAFLQEGHYNIFQIYPFIMVIFFLYCQKKYLKEK